MRKTISITLIFVLMAQCLYQLGVVTYFHLNHDYVAQVLCINKEKPMTMCYGNCFLKRNLKLDNETEKSALPAGNKSKIELPSFIVLNDAFTFSYTGMQIIVSHPDCCAHILSGFPTAIFHPPGFIS